MNNTNEKLLSLTRKLIKLESDRELLTTSSRLLEEKMLDSFGLIQLVNEIDKEFSIQIKTEDLTPENFSSIKDINELVNHYTE